LEIFYLTKVIEYVSQTVVKAQLVSTIQKKLYSAEALSPNAEFIIELQNMFNEQRNYTKDREAIRLTILTCCEVAGVVKTIKRLL
jgi:hypothetical protein